MTKDPIIHSCSYGKICTYQALQVEKKQAHLEGVQFLDRGPPEDSCLVPPVLVLPTQPSIHPGRERGKNKQSIAAIRVLHDHMYIVHKRRCVRR